MKCDKCGYEVRNAGYCDNCGASPATDPGKIFGMISLIIGCISMFLILLSSCPLTCLTGINLIFIFIIIAVISFDLILGITGIVLGILGRTKSKTVSLKNSKATIGMTLSIISIVISFVIPIVSIIFNFIILILFMVISLFAGVTMPLLATSSYY